MYAICAAPKKMQKITERTTATIVVFMKITPHLLYKLGGIAYGYLSILLHILCNLSRLYKNTYNIYTDCKHMTYSNNVKNSIKKPDTRDPYKAVWVSHSSMGDFLKCPKLYYLHNVYKNSNGRKIAIVTPHMSLGVAVHNVLENLSSYKTEERSSRDLLADYEDNWKKVSGKIGGFVDIETETEFKKRGEGMLKMVQSNMGPLLKKTVHFPPLTKNENGEMQKVDMLPHYYMNDTENLILCGKVDWLEYIPETDSLNVIDFKTGKHDEKEGSLQLPIYLLLLSNLQKRKITRAQYWYVDRDTEPVDSELPDIKVAHEKVYTVASQVYAARMSENYECVNGNEGCMHCKPYELIVKKNRGEDIQNIEYVGKGEYKQDLYIIT